jgi:serine/threonine protein kinase
MPRKPPNHVIAGRYELLEIAGKGGMAVVWRAIDHLHPNKRVVAVKRMLGELSADPSIVALFLEEARVGQTLRHPNIVEVIAFGQDDNRSYYLVLEWVDGLDMFEYMRGFHQVKVHVPWQAVALIAHQALHGLAAAHERRDAAGRPLPVIHRDLTPSNILIGANGVVKLADFGLARAMDRATMTLPHMIKGKLSYTAPEMLHGEKANERTDIYCLGLSLWECMAGKKLFAAGNQIQILEAVEQGSVPPLAPIRPDAPRPLLATIMRAVSRNPKDRWASAREMNRAIDDLLKSMPEPPDPARLGASVRQARDRLKAPPAVDSSIAIRESDNAIEVSAELVVEYASSPSAVRSLEIEISEPFEDVRLRSKRVRPAGSPKPPPPPAVKTAVPKPDPAPRSSTKTPRHGSAGPRSQRSKPPPPASPPEPPARPVGLGWPYNRPPRPGNRSK